MKVQADHAPPLSVLLVDDHAGVRADLGLMLRKLGLKVVAEASSSREGLALYEQLHPDVAVVDFHIGDECGADLADGIVEFDPSAKVLVYTGSEDTATYARVRGSAARGIALKNEGLERLMRAIHTIASGGATFKRSG